jgi:hypothetical protein
VKARILMAVGCSRLTACRFGSCRRAAVAAGTEVGKKAKDLMAAGALVTDDVVIGIIRDEVRARSEPRQRGLGVCCGAVRGQLLLPFFPYCYWRSGSLQWSRCFCAHLSTPPRLAPALFPCGVFFFPLRTSLRSDM